MKDLIFITLIYTLSLNTHAQIPEKISYQAVVRNSNNELVKNTSIGMQVSILEKSPDGNIIFSERHFPETNNNGLVSITNNEGTLVSGDFSSIDWSEGPYFLKSETDLTGGSNYTITGTTQLLSVPYALSAKTAERLSEPVVETDPKFNSSEAANITAEDISNLDNLSGTNTGDQDLSNFATKDNVLELNNTAEFLPESEYEPATKKYVDENSPPQNEIGDFAQGGIVFWVDETGRHGLVCSEEDQSNSMRWDAGSYIYTRARGFGLFTGEKNTLLIIASHATVDDGNTYAARVCNEYKISKDGKVYNDWYLPSKDELNLLYQNKSMIDIAAIENGGSAFIEDWYWSSTEGNASGLAWRQYFGDGSTYDFGKSAEYSVRAIRAF